MEQEWKRAWKKVKTSLQKGTNQMRIETYQSNDQQSRFFLENVECHLWLAQNLNSQKASSIMSMLEQMVETRSWKAVRGFTEDGGNEILEGSPWTG